MFRNLKIEDELVKKTMEEIEMAYSGELCDPVAAKMILDQVPAGDNCGCVKESMVRIMLAQTWTQRLYFDVRSALMGQISAVLTLAVIWHLGTINVVQGFILGTFVFIASLFLSRLFDRSIIKGTRKIISYLDEHKRAREFIVKRF